MCVAENAAAACATRAIARPVATEARERYITQVTTKLSVNLNKVATLRNTRAIGVPNLSHCAQMCLDAGADGITVHPRPDRRHIHPGDVADLAVLLRGYPHAELNIEGNPFLGLVEYAEEFRPTQCTLVPDDAQQATSDHGWDLSQASRRLMPIVEHLHSLGCRVSLFVDAVPDEMAAAREVGADRVELYTEPYAAAFRRSGPAASLTPFRESALAAQRSGLGVNAGHDLSLANLDTFLRGVPDVLEVSIGHALVADALAYGLPATVDRYLRVIRQR